MQTIVYIAGIATMLATISSVGVVFAMILGAVVAGVGGLIMAQSEVREIKSRVVHQQQSNAERQSELPTGNRTIACPNCKIDLLFRVAGELQCSCPQCKTTFCLDAGNRIYDINKPEKLAENSDDQVQAKLGETHHEGAKIQKDQQKAAGLFLKAADQGRASAQHHLGKMYMQGQGVPQDYEQAAEWLRKAAVQGYADAQYELGALYAKGQGVPQDDVQAAEWYRTAAGQGHADAQYGLGTLFGVGKGVPQDYEQSAKLIRKAADQGHAEAQGTLGALYSQGNGVPQDYGQAAQWFRKAANSDVHARYCLGMLYANGKGVPKDLIEACKWFHIAGAGGFSVAIENRELIESNLTIDEISEAKRRASSWMIELLKSTGAQVIEEVVNSPNADTATSKSSSNHRRTFCFIDGESLTPLEYGINTIKLSLEGSANVIKEIIGSNESKVQQEISAHRGPVQLHLIALQASVFYVCANTLSSSNHDVLTDVAGGVASGLDAIMGEYHSDNLYDIFKDYGHSLAKELERNDYDNFIDMGETANLVVKNISGQCNLDKFLAENPIEKLRIEEIVRRNGIGLLLMLLANRGITYTA